MFEPIHKKVKNWLETKIESSKLAVDNEWKVEVAEDDEGLMEIDTPKMPFKLIVHVTDKITYTALITTIKLNNIPADTLVPVFKELLIQNKAMEFSKFYLTDDDNTLCLRTDLYTKYMNKKEFNHALESVILGGRWLIAELGQTDDENRQTKEMTSLGSAELLKGTSKENTAAKMVKTGYPEEKAKSLVNRISVELGLETPSKPEEEKTTEESKGDVEDPVDRYIW
jgi:hypothetical protein